MNEDRVINFVGEVNEESALEAIMQLLYFDDENSKEPIYFYINSGGGSIVHGLAILDTIEYIDAPVYTICTGLAASMGAFLLSCGEKGKRCALKHSRILIHQPLISSQNGVAKKESEIRKTAESLRKSRDLIEKILSKNTNQPLEKLHVDCDRDNWMTAEEALKYGLIDYII